MTGYQTNALTMAEHHTQGRQGQGSRRRRYHSNRNYRHRMPRPEGPKPSLLKRVMSFFGFGKKKSPDLSSKKSEETKKNQPSQRVRIARPRSPRSGNPAAGNRGRRNSSVSTPPTDNARLYVGNLSFDTTEAELEDLFKGFGHVRSVEIIYNSRTYRSKGYAFVEMERLSDAVRAAEQLHGQPFMGRELRVSAAGSREGEGRHETERDARGESAEQTGDSSASEEDGSQRTNRADEAPLSVEGVAFEEEQVVSLTTAKDSEQ